MFQNNLFIDTPTRLMLSDWSLFANALHQYGASIRTEQKQTPVTDEQLFQAALQGPYASVLNALSESRRHLIKAKLCINYNNDDMFAQGEPIQLPESFTSYKAKELNESVVTGLIRQLDEQANGLIDAWHQFIEERLQALKAQLNQQGLELNELELKELSDNETVFDIQERFAFLEIELPKLKYGQHLSVEQYLYLKAYILIHSSLSRRQMAHDTNTIQEHLKSLKAFFKDTKKAEQELANSQAEAARDCIVGVVF